MSTYLTKQFQFSRTDDGPFPVSESSLVVKECTIVNAALASNAVIGGSNVRLEDEDNLQIGRDLTNADLPDFYLEGPIDLSQVFIARAAETPENEEEEKDLEESPNFTIEVRGIAG